MLYKLKFEAYFLQYLYRLFHWFKMKCRILMSGARKNKLSLSKCNFLKNNGPNFHLSAFCVWLSRDLCGSQLINAAHQHTPNLPRPWWYEFLIYYRASWISVNYYCGNCTMPVFNDFQILFIQRMGLISVNCYCNSNFFKFQKGHRGMNSDLQQGALIFF